MDRNTERREVSGCGDRSKPLSVPLVREEGVSLSFSLDRGDSGELDFIFNMNKYILQLNNVAKPVFLGPVSRQKMRHKIFCGSSRQAL